MKLLAVGIGALTGVLSGMGIGGGTLLVMYLTLLLRTEQHAAQGINLLYFLPVAASSLVTHIKNKRIVWKTALYCIVPGVCAAVAGSLLARVMETGLLKKLFGGLLILAGLTQIFRKQKNAQEGNQEEAGK